MVYKDDAAVTQGPEGTTDMSNIGDSPIEGSDQLLLLASAPPPHTHHPHRQFVTARV